MDRKQATGPMQDVHRDRAYRQRAYRVRLAAAAAALVPLGIATKLYAGPGQPWVAGHAGGFVYVMFWTLLLLAARPSLRPAAAAWGVLAATSLLEALQLWQPPALQAVRGTFLGHALLGSTFAWSDFPHYAVGAAAAVVAARALLPRPDFPASP